MPCQPVTDLDAAARERLRAGRCGGGERRETELEERLERMESLRSSGMVTPELLLRNKDREIQVGLSTKILSCQT
jgi:hypothetical protein